MSHPILNKTVVANALSIPKEWVMKITHYPITGNVQVVAKKRGSRFYKHSAFVKKFGEERWERSGEIEVKPFSPNRWLAINENRQYMVSKTASGHLTCNCADVYNQIKHKVPVVFCKHIAGVVSYLGYDTYNAYLKDNVQVQ